ncbi:TonB-dependent receptor [Alteromonadaceae bacterium M269]|nr:TonB-dependent receptor [Alteromonadaceae bacterium M269]
MKTFRPNSITTALIASGFALGSIPALAQQAEPTDKEEENVEVIQVTGIRGSLQRSIALKQSNTSIVEAISAEDIGKLPDTSVAESLARLPGLAGERRNGRTSGLSIRGFNENFVATSLNGRELLGIGDNRGVEFDLYPTEIVSNILVYKTPEAGQMVQGIGGTVDFQTVKPLNAKKTITFNGTFEKNQEDSRNPDFDNDGHRFAFNYVNQFADDKLGVALVLASLESPRQENQFRAWGYPTVNPDNPRRAGDSVDVPDGTVVYGGHDSFARSALLERDSVAAVVQYRPNDKLDIQFDALYIDFEENDARRGLEEGGPEWGTQNYTITDVQDGLVTAGFYDDFLSVIRNDLRSQEAELTTFGLNVEYAINDRWTATADLSVGSSEKDITDIESYSGVGRSGIDGRPTQGRSFEVTSSGIRFGDHPTLPSVDYTDPNLIRLAGPQPWGGALTPLAGLPQFAGGDPVNAQDGFVNQPIFDEDLDNYRFEVNGVLDHNVFSAVSFGVNYSEREKSKTNNGFFLTAPTFPNDGPIPDVLGVVSLDFIGIEGVLAYDSLGLFNDGFYTRTNAAQVDAGRLGDSYTIEEEVLTVFAKVDIDTSIGDVAVRGNIGVQGVFTDQFASGFSTFTDASQLINATPVSGGDEYSNVLPTLNLSFEVADSQFIRTSLGKVISRARLDDLRPNNQVSFSFNNAAILATDPAASAYSGSSGNPLLRPFEADQFDLSYENYFSDEGYYAISFFYKDLVNWHRSGATVFDFSDFFIPGLHQTSGDIDGDGIADPAQAPATFLGGVSFREDGLEGFVRGWELQTSLPLNIIHDSLDGFGIIASATFLDGELEDDTRVPGLSEEIYQVTAFYQKNGFEFRIAGTKRDEFVTETRGLSLALVGATDQGGELWDAQIGYDFSESPWEALHGLRITLQGQNLTDEETIQTNGSGDARQITQFQTFGRNFLLGFNYEF